MRTRVQEVSDAARPGGGGDGGRGGVGGAGSASVSSGSNGSLFLSTDRGFVRGLILGSEGTGRAPLHIFTFHSERGEQRGK